MFSQTSFKIGTFFGIPVKADFSLLLVAGMFVFGYASPRGSAMGALVAGLLSFAALMLAIFVHEAGHAFAATLFGCRVNGITLMFFGGYASISAMPRAPLRQAAISAAGPAAGFLLALAAGRLAPLFAVRGLSFLLSEVARMSLWLSVFNLIPAIPLDGGNIFRAVLTHFKGRAYATQVTCNVAKWLAVAMGIYGLLGRGGLFFILIAFFVWSASHRELEQAARGTDGDIDDIDDDVVIISPPPGGDKNEYTRIRHPGGDRFR